MVKLIKQMNDIHLSEKTNPSDPDSYWGISSLYYSSKDSLLLIGFYDGSVKIFNTNIHKKITSEFYTLKNIHKDIVTNIDYDSKSDLVFTHDNYIINILKLDIANKKVTRLNTLENMHNGFQITTMYYTQKDQLLITGSWDKSVKIFKIDVELGKASEMTILKNVHDDHVLVVHYNSDEDLLFTGSKDRSVKIFLVDSDKEVVYLIKHLLDVHTDNVKTLHYDSKHKLLFSGSVDKSVKIYRVDK